MQSIGSSNSELDGPLPARWRASLDNLAGAKDRVERLERALADAIFLDDDEWKRSIPVNQLNLTIQAQQRRVKQLERALGEMRARLEASESARREADAKAAQLASDLEDSTRVFRLHYDTLLDKEKEIDGLRAAVQALSSGDMPTGEVAAAAALAAGSAALGRPVGSSASNLLDAPSLESDLDSDLGSEGSL